MMPYDTGKILAVGHRRDWRDRMVNDSILWLFIDEDLSSSLHLATPNGWQPNATITLICDRGEVGLASNGWNSVFSTPFTTPFAAGTKYFFGFQVCIERGTYFSFLTLTNTHQAWNSTSGQEAWQLVGATFDVPDPTNSMGFVFQFDTSSIRRRGHYQLNVKTTHLCSKERTLAGFALSRTAVFSPSAHQQIPLWGRRLSAIFH
jgi:hypothetical protein